MTFTNRYSLVIIMLFVGTALLSGFPIKDIGANILFGLTVFLLLFSASVAGYVDARVTQYITALSMWLGFTMQSVEFFTITILGTFLFLAIGQIARNKVFWNLYPLIPALVFVKVFPSTEVFAHLATMARTLPISM